jgi:hypothetical protein
MAIFPLYYTSIINADVITTSTFQAGMVLIKDTNGRAIKADSQLLYNVPVAQKYARLIGFAASDHDVSNNTLIVPDVIGAGFVNVLNSSLSYQKDLEYSVPKRTLMDLQDETVSKYFNPSDTTILGKRGVGVYNEPNDIFITDQFVRVLHGDYGLDSTTLVDLNPGDLLTFGGGVNAGKLVKVNVNSFGPDILVVGVVEKYISATNLLHFRQTNYSLSFGTNNLTLFYDFSNPASYTSGTTVIDLSPNGKNGTIQNGPIYTNAGINSYFTFDHADDNIETNTTASGFGISSSSFTFESVFTVSSISGDNMVFGSNGGPRNIHFGTRNTGFYMGNQATDVQLFYPSLATNTIYYVSYITDYSLGYSKIFVNGTMTGSLGNLVDLYATGNIGVGGRSYGAVNGQFGGRIYLARIYNRALSNTEVLNQYNATKGRYGL